MQRHVPPPYTESGALIIESARKHFGPADKNAPAVALDLDMTAKLMQYLRLLDEKKNADPDQDMTEELAQKYYYQKLSAEEQKYYKEILKGLEDMETVIHVSTADDTKLQKGI